MVGAYLKAAGEMFIPVLLPHGVQLYTNEITKSKIVLMPSKPQCRLDIERLFASSRLIAELNGIKAVI